MVLQIHSKDLYDGIGGSAECSCTCFMFQILIFFVQNIKLKYYTTKGHNGLKITKFCPKIAGLSSEKVKRKLILKS